MVMAELTQVLGLRNKNNHRKKKQIHSCISLCDAFKIDIGDTSRIALN